MNGCGQYLVMGVGAFAESQLVAIKFSPFQPINVSYLNKRDWYRKLMNLKVPNQTAYNSRI
jgi:hypothetical protein